MGNGMSSLLLLGVSAALGLLSDASNPPQWKIYGYFGTVIATIGILLVFFTILMNSAVYQEIQRSRKKGIFPHFFHCIYLNKRRRRSFVRISQLSIF
jgi:hypothetical protein